MARLHAAMENARALVAKGNTAVAWPPRLPGGHSASDLPWLKLWQAVEARLPDKPRKVIQITACAETDLDPSVAARLARLASGAMGGGVIVLNNTPASDEDGAADSPEPVRYGPLPGLDGNPLALNPKLLGAYWEQLLQRAQLVILDTPPVLVSPLALAVAPTVDGVILTVEAEKTRAAVAKATRDALIAAGANLLGVALNKRRYHVPDALYRRL